jgi:hypothetical protein
MIEETRPLFNLILLGGLFKALVLKGMLRPPIDIEVLMPAR